MFAGDVACAKVRLVLVDGRKVIRRVPLDSTISNLTELCRRLANVSEGVELIMMPRMKLKDLGVSRCRVFVRVGVGCYGFVRSCRVCSESGTLANGDHMQVLPLRVSRMVLKIGCLPEIEGDGVQRIRTRIVLLFDSRKIERIREASF